jgi:amino acid efflux transporter
MRSSGAPSSAGLSTPAGIALYVGALLGPSLLLLPGLAARIAGPASLVAWALLLVLSGLLARVFMVLGRILPGTDGAVGYTRAGFGTGRLGDTASRVVGWCFLAGVVLGAPVVCLIGAAYVADLTGGGSTATVLLAAGLLGVVVTMALTGRAVRGGVQLALVALLAVLVAVAVLGAAPHARAEHWTPFAPHGWWSVGRAASVLMLSFVGWEAISPLVARLRDPGRQLPRIIGIAFAVTAVIYLGLAVVTVGVLGAGAGTGVPLADLLDVALGGVGRYLAAAAAVALTLAATNAYISGAVELADRLRGTGNRGRRGVQLSIAAIGLLLLGFVGAGLLTIDVLVAVPTALFVAVYALCTAAAVRLTAGTTRVLAGLACAVVLVILAFSGWALLAVAAVAVPAAVAGRRRELLGCSTTSAATSGASASSGSRPGVTTGRPRACAASTPPPR